MNIKKNKKNDLLTGLRAYRLTAGFTLVELLVVLSVIGILASIGVASYTRVRARARDSQRKQDLKAIQTGLEQYFLINADYPVDLANSALTSYVAIAGINDNGNNVITESPGKDIYNALTITGRYVEKWPNSPQSGLANAYLYKYFATGTLTTTTESGYKLIAKLETDTDAMENDGSSYLTDDIKADCDKVYEVYSSGTAGQACK